jgi:hypothetical protein
MSMTSNQIEQQRDRIYRRSRAQRVRTIDEAAKFIDTVGFCLLFASAQGIELPSLFEAVKGRRDVYIENWDADSDRIWTWKGELPADRRAYYGKALASGKPVFISLHMLPHLIALVAPESVDQDYGRGRISLDAKRLYDALRSLGPTPTMALREAAGFNRPGSTPRYHHALDELQRALLVLPVGGTREVGAWTSQIFELVERWFPHQVAQARRIDVDVARRALVKRYVQTVVAAQPSMIARVFGWPREQVNMALEDLCKRRILSAKGEWFLIDAP